MRKIYLTLIIALLAQGSVLAQGWPANYGGVMLQGFFWDSYKETPDCSPFGPWAYHQSNDATKSHKPGYTWATMYGAGWGSAEEWQVPVTTWSSLLAHKGDITPYIDILWLPQSGSTVCDSTTVFTSKEDYNGGRWGVRAWRDNGSWDYNTGNTITNPDCMGFVPVFYFHHGLSYKPDGTVWTYTDSQGHEWTPMSYFGTEAELRELISTFKDEGTGAVEDVVANHRGGLGTWSNDDMSIDFPSEYYKGELIEWGPEDVCCDDECGLGAGAPDCGGENGMGPWARDIDHHSPATQAKVKKYLDFLKNDLGYMGFRYDYARGFEPKHFAEYNTAIRPTFSVGEFWGSQDEISSWIHGVYNEDEFHSAAFDFPLQELLRQAFSYGNYRVLNDNGGLIFDPKLRRYAVTFLDNHDTFKDLPTDGSNYNYQHRITGNIVEANAFILAMPGTPCLFWPHFMHPTWHPILCHLIKVRRTAGITNESSVWPAELIGNDGIQWRITGNNGELYFQLGDAASTDNLPEGFTTVWQSDENNGKRVARVCITSNLASQVDANEKQNLLQGYPVISLRSGVYTAPINVNVSTSIENTTLVYTTNGHDPQPGDPTITDAKNFSFNENTTLKVGVLVNGEVPASTIVTREYFTTETSSNVINVYVKDSNQPHVFAWFADESNDPQLPDWPGYYDDQNRNKVTIGGQEWWHFEVSKATSGSPVNMLFCWNPDQSNQSKTPDLTGITSDVFYVVNNGVPTNVTNTYLQFIENPIVSIDKASGTYQGSVTATITATFSGANNTKIVYTTDGSEPTTSSDEISNGGTITFNTTGNHYLRAAIVKDGEVLNQVARTYNVENGTGNITPQSGVNIYIWSSWNPYLHAWKGESTNINGSWGSDQQKLTDRSHQTIDGKYWYKWSTTEESFKIIIHNNEGGTNNETPAITIDRAGDYYFVTNTNGFIEDIGQYSANQYKEVSSFYNSQEPITIYVNASEAPNLYVWNEDGAFLAKYNGNWNGNTMTQGSPVHKTDDDIEWFEWTVTGPQTVNAILNKNGNEARIEGISGKHYINYNGSTTATDVTEDYTTVNPLPSCATPVSEGLYFYFENDGDSYVDPYAWAWNNTTVFTGSSWPGEALTEVVGTSAEGKIIYRWTYTGSASGQPQSVVFSNNGESKTADFAFENGAYYTHSGKKGIVSGNLMSLSDMIKKGTAGVNQKFTISNDLISVYTDGERIFAKDGNGDANTICRNTGSKPVFNSQMEAWEYEQSNWVELILPQPRFAQDVMKFKDKNLLGHTIVGTLTDAVNPKIVLSADPIPVDSREAYTPNNYIVANFMSDAEANEDYFLMEPQPQEYAQLMWAVYKEEGQGENKKGYFYMASKSGANGTGQSWDIPLVGRVLVDNTTYRDGGDLLTDGSVYNVLVIIKKKGQTPSPTPMLMGVDVNPSDESQDWEVAVINPTFLGDNIVTEIVNVNVDDSKELVSVRYYNMMGVESKTPFEGVNIVVRDYSDGSRTTTKVLKR